MTSLGCSLLHVLHISLHWHATFWDHLQQLHLYFHNSANRTAVLKTAAQSLGLLALKVTVRLQKNDFLVTTIMNIRCKSTFFVFSLYLNILQGVKDTHWLSQHLAISTLQRNLPAVLAALAEETEANKCPIAKGLYGFCCTYHFVWLSTFRQTCSHIWLDFQGFSKRKM